MESLFRNSILQTKATSLDFKRYLHKKIDWNYRLIGIKGARGIGKTTLLLQHLKEKKEPPNIAIYVSLDDFYFSTNSLLEFVDSFTQNGGKYIYLDEVHKYPNWSATIKNIYDIYKDLKIIFTSSSAIALEKSKADLSRRAAMYTINELSFREYIELTLKIKIPTISLQNIIENHYKLSIEITDKIKPIPLFQEYLNKGAYPFVTEGNTLFYNRLKASINQIIEADLPSIINIEYSSVVKLKKLLKILAETPPFKPNITKLSEKIGTSRDRLLLFLQYLKNSQLINLLHKNTKGISYLVKPDKIFIHNTTLLYALNKNEINIGTVRELFFLNQVSSIYNVSYPDYGDFFVDNKYTFEIGGKNKTKKQIANIKEGYIVADNIEFGYEKKIPLWLFGFLY